MMLKPVAWVVDVGPFDGFRHVLLLFSMKSPLRDDLVQFFVGIIDDQLFEAIASAAAADPQRLHILETV